MSSIIERFFRHVEESRLGDEGLDIVGRRFDFVEPVFFAGCALLILFKTCATTLLRNPLLAQIGRRMLDIENRVHDLIIRRNRL